MVFGGWCWISSQSHPRTTQGFLSRYTQACSVIPQCTRIKSKLSRLPAFSSHCVTVFCLILQGPEALFYVKIIFVFSTILRKLQALFCLSELFLCFLLQVSSFFPFYFFYLHVIFNMCKCLLYKKAWCDLLGLPWPLWPLMTLTPLFSFTALQLLPN